jgi:TolB-like protein/class 3 adenylate cyclase/Flp pilus assembly protein TadD
VQDSERLPRRLAAILYADVAGYSRMTGADEDATHRRLSTYLDLISSSVGDHRGRVMHFAGDAVLAKFEAAVDALSCAEHIQRALGALNESSPAERKIQFRIGVNLGDVIEDRGDIYGDGVNVAARLESLAQPGGICISESVRTAVGDKLDLQYKFLGEQSVKNIAQPVRAYQITFESGDAGQVDATVPKTRRWASRTGIGVGVAALIAAGAGIAVWQESRGPSASDSERQLRAPQADRPSIAVLPFTNMSADPEQEYFADGITDDLITDLSKVSGLFVIARNSVFTYKGKHTKVQQVANDLGVRFVLEGSVRRAGRNVRINAQLIDATTGGHLWAERYDGLVADVFELQDKVTSKIVAALEVRLSPQERTEKTERGTSNIAAYDAFLRGWGHLLRRTPEDAAKAVPMFKRALELDPNYARAYAALAQIYWDNSLDSRFNRLVGLNTGQDDTSYAADVIAWNYLEKARDAPLSQVRTLWARMLQRVRRFDEAMRVAREAVKLGPNDPAAYDVLIENLIYSGNAEEAMRLVDESIHLDPSLPAEKLFLKGLAYYAVGQPEDALTSIERARMHNPAQTRYAAIQAATLVELGRIDEARIAFKQYVAGLLTYTTLNWTMFYWPFESLEISQRLASSLLEAGLRPSSKPYFDVTEQERLSGGEIRTLVSAKTMVGVDRGMGGLEDELAVTRDDKAQITEQGWLTYFRDGVSRIEDDLLCDPWWDFEDFCVAIFANPDGTRAEKDEYIFFTLAGPFTFSVFEPTS